MSKPSDVSTAAWEFACEAYNFNDDGPKYEIGPNVSDVHDMARAFDSATEELVSEYGKILSELDYGSATRWDLWGRYNPRSSPPEQEHE